MKSRILSSLLSLLVAAVFLFFAFRNIDLAAVWARLSAVSWHHTLVIILLYMVGLGLRGWRWWYTLPGPRTGEEFVFAQQSLSMGYALNNVAPRVGELGRIYTMRRATGRDYASLTSTVVMDRFLLDFLMMLVLFVFAMLAYRNELDALIPNASRYFFPLVMIFALGLVALVFLAVAPDWIRRLLTALGFRRLTFIWPRLDSLMSQLSVGFQVIKQPQTYLLILFQTILLWGSYVLTFFYGMHVFGIRPEFDQGLMIYAVSMLGIALPSPGGVGTYHFFAQKALTSLSGTGVVTATACATYVHGVGYLTLSVLGILAFLWYQHSRTGSGRIEVEPEASGTAASPTTEAM